MSAILNEQICGICGICDIRPNLELLNGSIIGPLLDDSTKSIINKLMLGEFLSNVELENMLKGLYPNINKIRKSKISVGKLDTLVFILHILEQVIQSHEYIVWKHLKDTNGRERLCPYPCQNCNEELIVFDETHLIKLISDRNKKMKAEAEVNRTRYPAFNRRNKIPTMEIPPIKDEYFSDTQENRDILMNDMRLNVAKDKIKIFDDYFKSQLKNHIASVKTDIQNNRKVVIEKQIMPPELEKLCNTIRGEDLDRENFLKLWNELQLLEYHLQIQILDAIKNSNQFRNWKNCQRDKYFVKMENSGSVFAVQKNDKYRICSYPCHICGETDTINLQFDAKKLSYSSVQQQVFARYTALSNNFPFFCKVQRHYEKVVAKLKKGML